MKEDFGMCRQWNMKAEARKIVIVVVDVLTEVGDAGAESDRRSYVARDAKKSE